jgi:hypothetical protein
VLYSSDPDNDGCWIATVDMTLLCRKYRLPPFSNEGVGGESSETKFQAFVSLCLHVLYNGKWRARLSYFMDYLKNTKELVVMLPHSQNKATGRAVSLIHRRINENGNWKLYNRWLRETPRGLQIGREKMIGEDRFGTYKGDV